MKDLLSVRVTILLPYLFRSLEGFLGVLVRSLGDNATLGDVLCTLGEHYGIMMTFNALSKQLYSLEQGMGENVPEFRVCLSQQVQILQMEYPSRTQIEHVEEVKQDCFYEGLNLSIDKYWPTKLMVKILSPILNCSKQPRSWKDGQRSEILYSQKPLPLGVECNSFPLSRKFISIQEVEG